MSSWKENLKQMIEVTETPEWASVVLRLAAKQAGQVDSAVDKSILLSKLATSESMGLWTQTFDVEQSSDGFRVSVRRPNKMPWQPVLVAQYCYGNGQRINIRFEQLDPSS